MSWLIVDGHEDIAMALLEGTDRDFGAPVPDGQALSLGELKRGGIGMVLATIFATKGYWEGETPIQAGERQMRCYEQLLKRHAQDLFRIESRGDLALCQRGGPIGMLHLMEGADPIRSPRDLSRWVNRGVRIVGLAWNTGNRYCGGVADRHGLTRDGQALFAEMRRLHVVPDVSHLTPVAFDSVMEPDEDLVVASHSNAAALCDHPRNLTDEQIRRIAARDGLVGIVLYNPFLGEGTITLDTVVAHIDHMVSLVGADHVGIGSDLDGGFTTNDTPEGIDSVADLPRIGDALLARGYAHGDVEKILAQNWIRVLRRALPQ